MNAVVEPKDLTRIAGVHISTHAPTEKLLENVKKNIDINSNIGYIDKLSEWRQTKDVAIVGGGPSLKKCLDELKGFDVKIACGSVHDYLIENGITPEYCVICDADPIMVRYIQRPHKHTKYLVASQCDPALFAHLSDYQVTMWHVLSTDEKGAKPRFDHTAVYGPDVTLIGGGCTVGTRAMVIAMGMGYYNLHLFGIDTCVSGNSTRYAYDLQDKEYEESIASDYYDIQFEENGPKFKVLGYHLAQLFDIKVLSHHYANRMYVTVHGDSLLSYFYELAERKLKEIKDKQNGNSNGLDRLGPVALHSAEDGKHAHAVHG